jgi:hypothetical protein
MTPTNRNRNPGSAPASAPKSAYRKFAFRKAIDFPLVSAAVVCASSAAMFPAPASCWARVQSAQGRHPGPDLHHGQGHPMTQRPRARAMPP